jgi:hypothetical protein
MKPEEMRAVFSTLSFRFAMTIAGDPARVHGAIGRERDVALFEALQADGVFEYYKGAQEEVPLPRRRAGSIRL